MSKGLGKVELAVSAALPQDGSWERRNTVSWSVARWLGKGIWRLREYAEQVAVANTSGEFDDLPDVLSYHKAVIASYMTCPNHLRPSLVASVSRAVRVLERRRLIEGSEAGSVRISVLNGHIVWAAGSRSYWARGKRVQLVRLKLPVDTNTYRRVEAFRQRHQTNGVPLPDTEGHE